MPENLVCPQCGNDDETTIGGSVFPEIYDGVVMWMCLKCGREWSRWPEDKKIEARLNAMRARWKEDSFYAEANDG